MPAPAIPRRIELIQTLGKGGFGAVYLADVHGRDDFVQRLAVKVLNEEMSAQPDIAARQRDEARLLARLNHDHIVRVVDLTELDGRPAVLMEYVEGADCSQLLRLGPLPVAAALQIGAAVASALDAAWSSVGPRTGLPLRVIHRDIKPANILVSRHGGVKVLDFGVARADFDREGKTGSVQFGTARFMAPEQWLYGNASHKVDVYALGVSLVEILSGLHMERAPLAPEAFAHHMEAVRAAVRNPSWPAELADEIDLLLVRLLAFDADDRPDASEVFEWLTHLGEMAPGESLGRWAHRVVPGVVAAQRERWASIPPPALSQALVPLATEQDVAIRTTEPTRRPVADPTPSTDTLAVARPGLHGRALAAIAGGIAALVVVGVGTATVVPRLFRSSATVPPAPSTLGAPAGSTGTAIHPRDAAGSDTLPPSTVGVLRDAPNPEGPSQPDVEVAPGHTPPTNGSGTSPPGGRLNAHGTAPTPMPIPPPTTASAPAQVTATAPITFSSRPWGATVSIDGREKGHTPMADVPLSLGSHTVTMQLDRSASTRTIAVGGHNPTHHMWTVETDEWQSSQ